MNKNTITHKKTIINKVLKHYMGAYDFISGDFKNKTIPTLKKLESIANTSHHLIDLLLESKILKSSVTFTETGEKWHPPQEPLVLFLSDRTHWDFWTEGFNDYLIRTEGKDSDQSSVLFEQKKSLSELEKQNIRKWLLER